MISHEVCSYVDIVGCFTLPMSLSVLCRERGRKERGEKESDEDEDVMDGGDPFKKLSMEELKRKVGG